MDLKSSYFKEIKKPTDNMLSFYEKMFKRNQSKFIRRSSLEVSHLGVEFDYDDKKMKLLGSMDANLMVAEDINDGKC
jgi:hypothetical protein